MTSYPTNIGTGLKANIVLHLPLISTSNNFANLISDLGRLGVSVKGVYGQGDENYGNFYDILFNYHFYHLMFWRYCLTKEESN